jgi:hypothetical protein
LKSRLAYFLRDGPQMAIYAAREMRKITRDKALINQAKEELGIVIVNTQQAWFWALPADETPCAGRRQLSALWVMDLLSCIERGGPAALFF